MVEEVGKHTVLPAPSELFDEIERHVKTAPRTGRREWWYAVNGTVNECHVAAFHDDETSFDEPLERGAQLADCHNGRACNYLDGHWIWAHAQERQGLAFLLHQQG
jgi:hypothetical protein